MEEKDSLLQQLDSSIAMMLDMILARNFTAYIFYRIRSVRTSKQNKLIGKRCKLLEKKSSESNKITRQSNLQ